MLPICANKFDGKKNFNSRSRYININCNSDFFKLSSHNLMLMPSNIYLITSGSIMFEYGEKM